MKDQHLGDGVYASFDGWHIILDLRCQDSFTRIALDPEVLSALDAYRQQITDHVVAKHNQGVDDDAAEQECNTPDRMVERDS